ncbi:MAG: hypothetical protein ACYS0E_00780 [Planctomycetota bacterium]
MLLVVVFIAVAIAALATISSGRVVSETRLQTTLQDETMALTDAHGQIQLAFNIVNESEYDEKSRNLTIRAALASPHVPSEDTPEWLRDPESVEHGLIDGTNVRVYRAADYISRLQKLKGETTELIDPMGLSEPYFVLEATGRQGGSVRLVSALVRENEPFSSFVFFQSQFRLGISGSPRGQIHSNGEAAFYFPNGLYRDGVTAVDGFDFAAGATAENTTVRNGNPSAAPINLEDVDFAALRDAANIYRGEPGLDAHLKFFKDGSVRIKPYTKPRWERVDVNRTQTRLIGYEDVTKEVVQQVQVGTTTEERVRTIVSGYETEEYTVEVPVYEAQQVEKTRQVPIYEEQTVTRTRWVQIFVPYDTGGGTVAGEGLAGEFQWVQESYETQEMVIVGYTPETYTVTEQVQVGTTTETRTRQVPIYDLETYTVEVPVYEEQTVTVTESVPVYEEYDVVEQEWQYTPAVPYGTKNDWPLVWIGDMDGVIHIDGRVVGMEGFVNGRVTVVAEDKVRITGDLQYVTEGSGESGASQFESAMLNGKDYTQPYVRNPDYDGNTVLGVIARGDVVFTNDMETQAEVNGAFMSVEGRVGVDGFSMDSSGEPTKNLYYGMTYEERLQEWAYNSGQFASERFRKDSLRRIGAVISDNRIMETYLRSRSDGTAYVDAGFKRGGMQFDFGMMRNPPPNFAVIPRPVIISFVPVFLMPNEKN